MRNNHNRKLPLLLFYLYLISKSIYLNIIEGIEISKHEVEGQ